MDTDEGSPMPEPPSKRHKKHRKKHKHSKEPSESTMVSPKASIKLKLKLGSETMGTKNFTSSVPTEGHGIIIEDKSSGKAKGSEAEMSEEEKWLEALEKGTLNSYGEVSSSKKDPSTLTARQKALLHGGQEDKLLQLPLGYKTVELTDEQKQKRQEKAKRRRQQANEKIENDKTSTVYKLLKKQDSKGKRGGKGRGGRGMNVPRIMYKTNASGISISLPPDILFPMEAQPQRSYPQPEFCGVEGCPNRKTSVCSKTKVPVCGLECYRKNLLQWDVSQHGQMCENVELIGQG